MIRAATIEAALHQCFAGERQIVAGRSCSGGCIVQARVLELDDGQQVFCKQGATADVFAAEADGLLALAAGDVLRVPKVLACSDGSASGFLLMEYCPAASMTTDYWAEAGRALARLHALPQERHGWHRDNYIGSSPQRNAPADDWPRFFCEQRLLVQAELLGRTGAADASLLALIERVCARIDDLLPTVEPSLVHGDLWSGNLIVAAAGEPVYIDPAVYCGHGEVDLAMTECFGGFPEAFYAAYREVRPIDGGYSQRRDLYNSYHMLNHLLIFGGGYAQSARSLLQAYA